MHAGAAARVLCKSQRVDNTLCWLVVHTPRSSLRLAGARSSPGRVEVAYTMLGDDPAILSTGICRDSSSCHGSCAQIRQYRIPECFEFMKL
jgi:hypothetical protein